MNLRESITILQELAQTHNVNIIIVGGAIVRLIGPKTAIKRIDETKKIILLEKAEDPNIKRSEENRKTIVDIDCLAFSKSADPFNRDAKEEFDTFKENVQRLKKDYHNFPAISMEPVLYHPFFPKPNPLTQFVSSVESYHDQDFFFRLGKVKEDVQRKSLDPWTIAFTDSSHTITTFMPTAVQRRYAIRGFTIKPKDRERIFGLDAPFAQFVANFRIKTKGKYDGLFTEWDNFADRIATSKHTSMVLKKNLWTIYWQTIGTYLAHGTGFIGKILLPLGNTFFAGK